MTANAPREHGRFSLHMPASKDAPMAPTPQPRATWTLQQTPGTRAVESCAPGSSHIAPAPRANPPSESHDRLDARSWPFPSHTRPCLNTNFCFPSQTCPPAHVRHLRQGRALRPGPSRWPPRHISLAQAQLQVAVAQVVPVEVAHSAQRLLRVHKREPRLPAGAAQGVQPNLQGVGQVLVALEKGEDLRGAGAVGQATHLWGTATGAGLCAHSVSACAVHGGSRVLQRDSMVDGG